MPRLARLVPSLVTALLALAPTAGSAAPREIPLACFAQCRAGSRDLAANVRETQVCLVRCRAGIEFAQSTQNVRAARGRGRPVSLATLAAMQPVPVPVAARTEPVIAAAPRAERVAAAAPRAASPMLFGLIPGAHAAPFQPAAASAVRWGAIYAATPPNAVFGLARGQGDRLAAHARAESECLNRGGGQCRIVAEFSGSCGAAAHGTRTLGLVQTQDPSTYRVISVTAGSGATLQEAERAALAACTERDRSARCRIAVSACNAS